jgi:MFS family permease
MSKPPGREPPPGTVEARVEAAWRRARPALALTMIFAAAAAVLGPLIVGLLVWRGATEHRWSWLALGVLCGAPLVLVICASLRRATRSRPRAPR